MTMGLDCGDPDDRANLDSATDRNRPPLAQEAHLQVLSYLNSQFFRGSHPRLALRPLSFVLPTSARLLIMTPDVETIKGLRDRAILATFLYHGLRCEELCGLRVKDIQTRRGVMHFRIFGKGSKIRYIPAHPASLGYIDAYLTAAGHGEDRSGPLFRPVRNNATGDLTKPLSGTGIYNNVVLRYAKISGIITEGFCTHSLRATAATNALDHKADIAKVQEWLGHANVSRTKLYDRRASKVEDSPTFKVEY